MDNADQKPAKKRRVGCGTVILIMLVLGGVIGGWCYWLWKAEPVYWVEHEKFLQQTTPQERLVMAESVEKRILDMLSVAVSTGDASSHTGGDASSASGSGDSVSQAVTTAEGQAATKVSAKTVKNPDAVHSLLMTTNELNAWMDQRLDGWAANQGLTIPDFIEEPMLAIEGKDMVIAFRYKKPPISQVVSLVSRVEIEKGEAIIRVRGVRGGRLRLPGVKAASKVVGSRGGNSKIGDIAEKITEVFDGKTFDPVIKLNHQRIRMLSFVLQKDGALIKFKAVQKNK